MSLRSSRAGELASVVFGGTLPVLTVVPGASYLAGHVGRSYVFGLNAQMSVDSTHAGNPARFINHAPYKRANLAVMSKFCYISSLLARTPDAYSPAMQTQKRRYDAGKITHCT